MILAAIKAWLSRRDSGFFFLLAGGNFWKWGGGFAFAKASIWGRFSKKFAVEPTNLPADKAIK